MKNKYVSSLLGTAALTLGMTLVSSEPSLASQLDFSCQYNDGSLTTVATNNDGAKQSIFHWDREKASNLANPQQLCNSVSQKLNNYSAKDKDLSSLTFKPQEHMGLPAICVAEPNKQCSLLLFTLEPASEPYEFANTTLVSILDQDLQSRPVRSSDRGIQSTAYHVDFWQLFGW